MQCAYTLSRHLQDSSKDRMNKTTKDLITQLNALLDIQEQFRKWVQTDTISEVESFKIKTFLDKETHGLIKDIIHIEKL